MWFGPQRRLCITAATTKGTRRSNSLSATIVAPLSPRLTWIRLRPATTDQVRYACPSPKAFQPECPGGANRRLEAAPSLHTLAR